MKLPILALMTGLAMGATVCASQPKAATKSHTTEHKKKTGESSFLDDAVRIGGGLIFCAGGVYALLQAKQSFDDDQSLMGKATKVKSKVTAFANKLMGEKEDPVDSFYAHNKDKIHASGWAAAGLASLAFGLKLILGSSQKAK